MRFAALVVWFGVLTALPSVASGFSGTLNLTATILSKNVCKFSSGAATLAFGNLDPANRTDVTATSSIDYRCIGSEPVATFLISADGGLHGGNRMENATLPGSYLPYGVTLSPNMGSVPKNVTQTLTITGTIAADDYLAVPPGSYSDTVTLTIQP